MASTMPNSRGGYSVLVARVKPARFDGLGPSSPSLNINPMGGNPIGILCCGGGFPAVFWHIGGGLAFGQTLFIGQSLGFAFRQSEMYNVCMEGIQFVWDEKKNIANRRKHGVSFEEAKTAFYDERAKLFFDPDHSENEDRFILLAVSFRLRVLVVCHCYRENDKLIRIISARKADKTEQEDYER